MEARPTHVNLNSNLEAKYEILPIDPDQNLTVAQRIQNPLAGLAQSSLLSRVDYFAESNGLKHILPLLRKGALVARDPTNYEDITGPEALDDSEIDALRDEVLHKWRQPRPLYMTIILCSIGAAVQGWDQTGTALIS